MTEAYDVVVIGGGLAGRMAALAAAEAVSDVALIEGAESTLHSSTGSIDLLGYVPDQSEPLVDPSDGLDALPEGHPYHRVGGRGIRDGMALFDSVVGDAYLGSHTDRNGLLPTSFGTAKPTARYPASFEPGLLSKEAEMLVIGLGGLPGFDGEFISRQLAERVPYGVRGANLDLIPGTPIDQPALRIAQALDRNETWPGDAPIRERLGKLIVKHHRGEPRIGLPAVLGREEHEAVWTHLEEAIGARIFEIPTTPPSLPGIRLRTTLDRALRSRSVTVRDGVSITGYREPNGRWSPGAEEVAESGREITELQSADHPSTIHGRQYILATGGLVGGGLVESDGTVSDTIFDLPAGTPSDRGDWIRSDPFAAQPFARFGLSVDDALRPLQGSEPSARNLRACGAILGGYDPTTEHSGSGVAIATGVRAGRLAAREVADP